MPWVKHLTELSSTCLSREMVNVPVSFLPSHSPDEAKDPALADNILLPPMRELTK